MSSLSWLTLRATLTGLVVAALLVLSAFSSVFWYTFFYSLYIPQLSLELPVTFDFSQPQPSATVSLASPQWSYSPLPPLLSLSSSASKAASKSPLYPLQAYDVSLAVTLPDTAGNARIGVVTLHSKFMHRATPLASSTHSFLPPYRSRLIRTLYELAFAIPLTLGLWRESHTVDVLLYERYKEPPATLASTHLSLNITSPHANALQLYSVTLTLSAQLTGLKHVMHRYRLTSAVLGVAALWSAHVAVLLAVAVACFVGRKHDDDEECVEQESGAKLASGIEGLLHERAGGAGGGEVMDSSSDSAVNDGGVDADRELRGYRLDGEQGEMKEGEESDPVTARRRRKPSR